MIVVNIDNGATKTLLVRWFLNTRDMTEAQYMSGRVIESTQFMSNEIIQKYQTIFC